MDLAPDNEVAGARPIEPAQHTAGFARNGLRGPTVLVVDDDAATREAYVAILRDAGFGALEAANGGDAIWLVHRHEPAVILMDLIMPVVNGIDAAESLRKYPRTARIPIVAVTASNGNPQRERMRALCNAVLTKPCSPLQIMEEVRRALAKTGTPDDVAEGTGG